ncbi:MAG: hypothetical protein V1779_16785 [bacterium]
MKKLILFFFFIYTFSCLANEQDTIENFKKDSAVQIHTPTVIYSLGLGIQGLGVINLKETFQGRNITGYLSTEFPIWNNGRLGAEFGILLWKHSEKELISHHFPTNFLFDEGALLFTSILNYYSQPYGSRIRPKIFLGFINLLPLDNIVGLGLDYKMSEMFYLQISLAYIYRSDFGMNIAGPTQAHPDKSTLLMVSLRY